MTRDEASNSIITVGDGRGFVVQAGGERLVITAAHCLPELPAPMPARFSGEATYHHLLAARGAAGAFSCECVFADPIADVAVLSTPDGQTYYRETNDVEWFLEQRAALPVWCASGIPAEAWLLAIDGSWRRCSVECFAPAHARATLTIHDATGDGFAAGTSGSPILSAEGHAIGVVSVGDMLNPLLSKALPAGLLALMLADEGA